MGRKGDPQLDALLKAHPELSGLGSRLRQAHRASDPGVVAKEIIRVRHRFSTLLQAFGGADRARLERWFGGLEARSRPAGLVHRAFEPEPVPPNRCRRSGKLKFSRLNADKALVKLQRKGKAMGAYRCPFCGYWHLTSQVHPDAFQQP